MNILLSFHNKYDSWKFLSRQINLVARRSLLMKSGNEYIENVMMYRVCSTKRPTQIFLVVWKIWLWNVSLWNMTFSGYLNVYKFHRQYCLLPEKQMWSHCSFTHTFEKTFLPIQMQRYGPVIWAKSNWNLFNITKHSILFIQFAITD